MSNLDRFLCDNSILVHTAIFYVCYLSFVFAEVLSKIISQCLSVVGPMPYIVRQELALKSILEVEYHLRGCDVFPNRYTVLQNLLL